MAVKFKKTKVHASLMLAFGGSLAFGSAPLFAQQQQQLDRVEVTGSLIKRIDAETAAPLQIITREDIQNSGRTTLQEVLRSVTADSTGSIPTSFTNGFASGSAAVSLRGLGVNSTLVLLNGRRMTTYGLADDGTRNFVDLNTLPLEAVDRIEILKEGASAIYGADAVGGVVNVILRKSYVGASIGGSYGQTGDSDGNDIRGWGSFGFGDLAKDKYNVFFTIEAQKTDNIWARDRGFIGETDLRLAGILRPHQRRESSVSRCRADVQHAVWRDSKHSGSWQRPPDKCDPLRSQPHRPRHGFVPLQHTSRC